MSINAEAQAAIFGLVTIKHNKLFTSAAFVERTACQKFKEWLIAHNFTIWSFGNNHISYSAPCARIADRQAIQVVKGCRLVGATS